tara:strand:- start:106 stop:483 length:378 start_codon:yes stop_codon:yes gene_type:complete
MRPVKKLLTLLIILFSLSSEAKIYKILVTGWSYKPGFDYMLHLKSPLSPHHFVLDCQSFLHELVLYEAEREDSKRIFELYFNPQSCYELGSWIISHTDMGGKMCFNLDTEKKTVEISTENYQFCF